MILILHTHFHAILIELKRLYFVNNKKWMKSIDFIYQRNVAKIGTISVYKYNKIVIRIDIMMLKISNIPELYHWGLYLFFLLDFCKSKGLWKITKLPKGYQVLFFLVKNDFINFFNRIYFNREFFQTYYIRVYWPSISLLLSRTTVIKKKSVYIGI